MLLVIQVDKLMLVSENDRKFNNYNNYSTKRVAAKTLPSFRRSSSEATHSWIPYREGQAGTSQHSLAGQMLATWSKARQVGIEKT